MESLPAGVSAPSLFRGEKAYKKPSRAHQPESKIQPFREDRSEKYRFRAEEWACKDSNPKYHRLQRAATTKIERQLF
jgi:hypothetical protein